MAYGIGLIVVLSLLWLGLSGHYEPLILGFGVISILISYFAARRFGVLDREGAPYARLPQLLSYWAWLVVEIAKANRVVIRACLRPSLDIDPALVSVRTTCGSDLAKTVFANSITLTPGTVSVEVEGDKILVHALYASEAQPEAFEEMDRRARVASDG